MRTIASTGNMPIATGRKLANYRFEVLGEETLSFPAGEPLPGSEELLDYLGDIAISVPTAQRQADAAGHSLEAEVQLLAIHGVLHLLGHDHLDAEEKAAIVLEGLKMQKKGQKKEK